MNLILADFEHYNLLPLTFSRPVSHLLVGIDTIYEKWEYYAEGAVGVLTPSYLQEAYPLHSTGADILVNASAIPSIELLEAIYGLKSGQRLSHRGRFIAGRIDRSQYASLGEAIQNRENVKAGALGAEEVFFNHDLHYIGLPSDIFALNDAILRNDYARLSSGIKTTAFPEGVKAIGSEIFIHRSAIVQHAVLNASTGPIYIGPHTEIMEGSLIRGPFAIGEGSTLKMGAKIYGATSVGKHCKLGGEVNNAVINDYSNKGHDGFLGNSVLGSWCNLGADTNTSNLKNNYGEVNVWSYAHGGMLPSGRQFHGLIMGDHSKAAINTMFNTGTVVGMCANLFGSGFPPKFIPSFTWGNFEDKRQSFDLNKAFEAAEAMMKRRNIDFTATDRSIFRFVFEADAQYRS